VALAIGVGTYLRVRGIHTLFLWGDENHTLAIWQESYATIASTYDSLGSGIALPLLQRLGSDILGTGLWALRLPALLGGLGSLLLLYPASKRLVGPSAAALATLALAINPAHVFYSRFARSYSLCVLLAILLVYATRRVMERDARDRFAYVLLVASGALLPYAHLFSASFVAAIGLAALLSLALEGAMRGKLVRLTSAFALAGTLGIALHLPAWGSVWEFVTRVEGGVLAVHFGALDVAALLAGGRNAGAVLLLLAPVAAAAMLAARRPAGILLTAGAFGPVPVLLLLHPAGGLYPYFRYLLVSLPCALLLLAWAWTEAWERAGARQPLGKTGALLAGTALLAITFWTGPLGRLRSGDGPFGNTNLALRPLPAFDVPSPGTPPFYRELGLSAEVRRIIEAPPAPFTGAFLYRNYYLQHGKETWFGSVHPAARQLLDGPFVSLLDPQFSCKSGADLLILHLHLGREVWQYWNWVYRDPWQPGESPEETRLMKELNFSPGLSSAGDLSPLAQELAERLGRPIHRDEDIAVWRLTPEDCK
jgi:hypothetical protein